MTDMHTRPHVLVVSGLDPSGGAGIQADIQAITALGCHPLPVLSCVTVQDTVNVYNAAPIDADIVRQQLERLAEDTPIHAVKTGALGNAAIVDVLVDFLSERRDIPLITDPVIKAAGGGDLADEALIERMKSRLFPLADMITPNGEELIILGGTDSPDSAAANLLAGGCGSVLATGGHGKGNDILNLLYEVDRETTTFRVERYGGEYHGTGCTLAAAISAGRATGLANKVAIAQAQNYVSRAIHHALRVGKGQPVPDRGIRWEV